MSTLRSDEIASALEQSLRRHEAKLGLESVGSVIQVRDGIAEVYGLDEVQAGEMVEFSPGGERGLALSLNEGSVGVLLLDDFVGVQEGQTVKRLHRQLDIPVGKGMLGRVVDSLGRPLDGKGEIVGSESRPLEIIAPRVLDRGPVNEPLHTGIKAIDSLVPIGRGQRELIIGDRQIGKTAILVDTIINQKETDVHCIYVAIGQKGSAVKEVVEVLEKHGAMAYTTVVSSPASSPAALQFLAPYAGCAMGEYFMFGGQNALVVYDDLSKQANAYREISLLLRRPPGREAFPGDIFYLHSRLLERAAKMSDELGGGSLTALPVIETLEGNETAYIPTNVISITDGQIFLYPDLFNAGVRPPINVGLSVSRVGGAAQTHIIKKLAGMLRLELAQYREIEAFAKFGSDLDSRTQAKLARGARMVEVLKQGQFSPLTVAEQATMIFAGARGHLDAVAVEDIGAFEEGLLAFVPKHDPDLFPTIDRDGELTDDIESRLAAAIVAFAKEFVA
ncbi:F0F1 ATP synthase subunit alpha [bacterium]|nr:F0F1 ATP synthase subunit alpha [bacterium]